MSKNKAWETRAGKAIKKLEKRGENQKAQVLSKIFTLTKGAMDGEKLSNKKLEALKKMSGIDLKSLKKSAANAAKLAVLFLGDQTPEDIIESQARDFMQMDSKKVEASLLRFEQTKHLYEDNQR